MRTGTARPSKLFPSLLTLLNLLAAGLFCVFFCMMIKNLPDAIPLHFTAGVGVDRWGAPSELTVNAVIPAVTSILTALISVILIKKDLGWISYLLNGLSLVVTLLMALTTAFMLRLA